jgi:hypothetical protein
MMGMGGMMPVSGPGSMMGAPHAAMMMAPPSRCGSAAPLMSLCVAAHSRRAGDAPRLARI